MIYVIYLYPVENGDGLHLVLSFEPRSPHGGPNCCTAAAYFALPEVTKLWGLVQRYSEIPPLLVISSWGKHELKRISESSETDFWRGIHDALFFDTSAAYCNRKNHQWIQEIPSKPPGPERDPAWQWGTCDWITTDRTMESSRSESKQHTCRELQTYELITIYNSQYYTILIYIIFVT